MLTFESPLNINGMTIYRDFSDPGQFYYLPQEHARVSENGKGLSFVVYTEDVSRDPDFTEDEDRAGGFLTLEVELGPSPEEVEAIKGQIPGAVSLAEVPFTDGTVTLYVLSKTGAGTAGSANGFDVAVAGSTKPSLSGRQTAVFSVRLGGKAANILWETLRSNGDPQAVVTYDLEYRGIQPAYNLEVTIDFKETFSYLRQRIGLNLLVASADLDLMTQSMINDGKITVREVDFTGHGSANSPVAGEGGILKLVRDLMSPTLFTTLPIPTPDYRALPDSATRALETGGGTKAFLSGGDGTAAAAKQPVSAGTDLKITHTPIAAGQTPGAQIDLSAIVEPAAGVTGTQVKALWRVQGSGAFQEIALQRGAATPATPTPATPTPATPTPATPTPATPTPATPTPAVPTPAVPTPGTPAPGTPAPGTPTPATPAPGTPTPPATPLAVTTPTPASPTPSTPTPPTPTPATPPAATPPAATDNTYTGKIPGQPAGTTIEYYIRASGAKGAAPVTQTLPAAGETGALTFTVGAAASSSNGVGLKVPQTDGPLIGYSLCSIDTTQQIKRTFTLNKAEATTYHYHPSGALSANRIGPAFDASKQVTRVALGQGPFRLIEIKLQAGFDFDTYAIKAATVRIQYGKKADGTFMQALSIPLTKDKPTAKTQFFADDAGTQTYDYWVEFTYDAEHVIGTTPGHVLSSPKFEGVDTRSITVDLKVHSPLIPVQVTPGVLSLTNGLIKQVQVRVAPTPTAEGRVVVLDATHPLGERLFVVPANPASRVYHLEEKFFFEDGSTTVEKPNQSDPQVVVNEPADLVFKMIPQFADPTGLVKEVLVDAVYRHTAGAEERSTLHLSGTQPHAEFAVLLAGTDPKEWDASFRFVMNSGDPLESVSQHIKLNEPLVTLKKAGFKVVTVSLLDDALFTATPDLQGVRVTLGGNVADPAQPVATIMLRPNRTSGSVIVPGVLPDAGVTVAVDALRHNQPPQRTTTTLAPAEKELYVTV